ncbi:MAG: ATP-binding protein [Acidimicrobiales bacterium]
MTEGDSGFDPAPLLGRIAGAAGDEISTTHLVTLRDLPVALVLRCDQYLEDVVREVSVIRLDERPVRHTERGTALLATVETLLHVFAAQRSQVRRDAEAAAEAGNERFDLALEVPAAGADAADLLVAVLGQVDDLSRHTRLLTSPMPEEGRAFLAWFLGQMAGQVRGSLPPEGRYGGDVAATSPPPGGGYSHRAERPRPLDEARRVSRRLTGGLPSAPQGRHFVVSALEQWGRLDQARRAELPTAELLSNALFHARGAVSVVVLADEQLVRVEVHDRSVEEPVARRRQRAAETGRGMLLVDSICDRWGSEVGPDGKCVWFELDRRAPG